MAVLRKLLSGDLPRSPALALILIVTLLGLAFAPFLFSGTRSLDVAAKICVFVLLVASYDLLLGYAGIVSFAHTMFFGIGAYGVAITISRLGPSWASVLLGALLACLVSIALSVLIGLFSLRVKTIFFAMITLAVASFFAILASQLSWLTGGEDGLNYKVPELLLPANKPFDLTLFGTAITGKTVSYYIVFAGALAGFGALLRVVNSPFGRVLQAIRENDFRAEAIGYRTVVYRTVANCVAAIAAAAAGILYALWLRYTGPETTLSLAVMIDILLMVVIGGMGTMYGAALGATLFIIAQNYLQDLMKLGSDALSGLPAIAALVHPDRWLLWLGILFVLSVYYFPTGIVGRLRGKR